MIYVNEDMDLKHFEGLRCIAFDCDGVLVDSHDGNETYYNNLRKACGLPLLNDEDFLYCHTHTVGESIKYVIPEDKMEMAYEFLKTFDYATLIPKLAPMSGIHELLHWLRDEGFYLAVCTSRGDTTPLVFSHFDFEGIFHPVMTSLTVTNPKPAPEGLENIIKTLDITPDQMAFVGDGLVDSQAANSVGARFWAYGSDLPNADLRIPDYAILLRMLKKAFAK